MEPTLLIENGSRLSLGRDNPMSAEFHRIHLRISQSFAFTFGPGGAATMPGLYPWGDPLLQPCKDGKPGNG